MTERIPNILERLASLETAVKHSDDMMKSSVDDIKATIRSEISDLKGEQIGDLRAANQKLFELVDRLTSRLDAIERTQAEWKTGASVANWMIRLAIGFGGAAAGILGYKHIGTGP
jgi:uncharacterized protein HemX